MSLDAFGNGRMATKVPPAVRLETRHVPGTSIRQILVAAQYYAARADWIISHGWWYRKTFALQRTSGVERLRLHFITPNRTINGLRAYLNGKY